MMRVFILILLLCLPLIAQAQQSGGAPGYVLGNPGPGETEPMPLPPPVDACNPPLQLIGKPKAVLMTMKFAHTTRILGPDDAATMDYSPGRLNIIYDKNGIIREVKCG